MSYVQSVLQPGERIIADGRLHWISYGSAILALVCGLVLVGVEYRYWPQHHRLIAATAILFGGAFLVLGLRAWYVCWITEIAVTDRRIIYKRGLIYRRTEEMNMDKVASVDVDQSILGRLLDYGTIRVIGVGGQAGRPDEMHDGIEQLHRIAAPLALRNAIIAK
jgi:uncharacterized membrane protein YdbT with pleckstrin-like domain